jgi:hypothetical protein
MSATVTDYTYALHNGQTFFGEKQIGPTYCMMFCICMIELNFEE